jgi:hypothetical protein
MNISTEFFTDKRLHAVSLAARGVYSAIVAHLAQHNLLVVEAELVLLELQDDLDGTIDELLAAGLMAEFADGTVGVLRAGHAPAFESVDAYYEHELGDRLCAHTHECLQRLPFAMPRLVMPEPGALDRAAEHVAKADEFAKSAPAAFMELRRMTDEILANGGRNGN